jgi:hypothetical protein
LKTASLAALRTGLNSNRKISITISEGELCGKAYTLCINMDVVE